MKLGAYLIILTVLVQLSHLYHVTEAKLDKECVVRDIIKHDMQEEGSFNLTFYIAPGSHISFQIYFVGLEKPLNNDLLFLFPNRGEIQRKRNGYNRNYEINLLNKIPHGWNNMTITLKDRKLQLGIFYTTVASENEIEEISIMGKYITDCANKTPVWEISKSNDVSIPLIGLSNLELQLSSDRPFQPEFVINAIPVPFSFDTELLYRKSGAPLPADDYRIAIARKLNSISVFAIYKSGNNQLIMNANVKEDLKNLRVSSLDGTFDLLLDAFVKEELTVDTTVIKRSFEIPVIPTMSSIPVTETTMNFESTVPDSMTESIPHVQESQEKDCATASSSNWTVTIGLLLSLNVVMLLIIIYLAKEKIIRFFQNQRPRNNDDEESVKEDDKKLLLGEKICSNTLKEVIKSEHTEQHGQTNSSMTPHYKDVCEVILHSDKKNDSRKKLGELDLKKPTKVILVIGGTGSGKSSFINVITNFIYDVKYEDSFRFKLVNDMNNTHTSGNNSTEKFTAYAIPFMPDIKGDCNYIFIDTPGFGDSRGIEEDKRWNEKFYNFLQENSDIAEVNGICIVMKKSTTRLTKNQEYIIGGLFSKFGRDIKNNIYAVVSNANESSTNILKILKKSDMDCKMEVKFNIKGLYNDTKFEGKSQEDINDIFENYWDLTMRDIKVFLNDLRGTNGVSLFLTNVVVEENKDIENLKDKLFELIAKEANVKDQERQDIQSEIKQNQELLMAKLEEAKKLDGRLKKIPCKENPLAINDYLDILIEDEEIEGKKSKLRKLKERNTKFNQLLDYHLGKKEEKIE